jgi:hypothetical protein
MQRADRSFYPKGLRQWLNSTLVAAKHAAGLDVQNAVTLRCAAVSSFTLPGYCAIGKQHSRTQAGPHTCRRRRRKVPDHQLQRSSFLSYAKKIFGALELNLTFQFLQLSAC